MKIMKSVKVLAAVIASAMLSVNANAESLNSNAKAASPKSEIAGSAKNVDGVDKSVKFDYEIDMKGRITRCTITQDGKEEMTLTRRYSN